MKNKILKNNKKNACLPKLCFKHCGQGFVLLYTMAISSVILAVALGIANIALKEAQFSTSARATNEAFFAADTGAECALFYDKLDPTQNAFSGTDMPINCGGTNGISVNSSGGNIWTFTIPNLGDSGAGCANVSLIRNIDTSTTIISKGYNKGTNNCGGPGSSIVERELKVTY
jgi:hypothetical protein